MPTDSQTTPHRLFRRVADVVRRKQLIGAGDRVLVAVSGGADSVCLLTVLHELRERNVIPGLALHIAHVNYGLRGEESEGDEAHVRNLGARLQLPLSCERVYLRPKRGETRQSAAREARYAVFERLRREHGLTAVATGHTADDQAETILMWLVRGSGTGGLSGIPVKRAGNVIRPLLDVTREEVLDYLASREITYRSDTSNAQAVYRRNRVRLEVMPLLRSLNPRLVEALAREADIFSAEDAVLENLSRAEWTSVAKEQSPERVVLDGERLLSLPLALQRRLVRRALFVVRGRRSGVTFRHVSDVLERVLAGRAGAGLSLPGNVRVKREGPFVTVVSTAGGAVSHEILPWTDGMTLSIPGEIRLGQNRLLAAEGDGRAAQHPDRSLFVIDGERVGGPLIVRPWKPGDWFCPAGMDGHRKKLQDFFMDEKIHRSLRDRIPLVVAPAGIVWIAGYRGDDRFAAGTATTRPVTLSLTKEHP